MKRLGIELAAELHSKAKAHAFLTGRTLTQYIIELIEKDLKEQKEKE